MNRIIFRSARLLDGNNPTRTDATVIVEGDRITAINPGAPVAQRTGDTMVNLSGLTLMPGMVSGHFHAAFNLAGEEALSLDEPEIKQAYWALANAQTALRCGYTSVVGAGTFFNIDTRLAEAIDTGKVPGPRLIPASRDIVPRNRDGETKTTPFIVACWGPKAYREAALGEIEGGARVIKLFASKGHSVLELREMSMEELRAAVDVAHEHGVRTRAHVAGRDQILKCVHAGVDIIDHADGMDDECIEAFLEHGSFVLPSLYMPYLASLDSKAPGAELFDSKDYEYMRGMLAKAAAAGVKFVTGDDYGIGVLTHGMYSGELACYVEQCGISPLDVIKWATSHGGEMTGIADLGTIAPGKLADMIVVDGDPSIDIGVLSKPERITAVIKAGEVVSGQLPVARPAMQPAG